ncbi:hypothetical protein SAMN05192562_104215 [Kosakonia arachidis]|uniref:Uncharacterized protein n=1 Tax=Kosakonia arachidis TaxID=551989 RepID=A0A1I7CZF8_9ENTR|nr:hypothetical protein SAMN05192562_104215 [Kosakonia arachidis]
MPAGSLVNGKSGPFGPCVTGWRTVSEDGFTLCTGIPAVSRSRRSYYSCNRVNRDAKGMLCRYSNSIDDFVYKKNSKCCPNVKSFDTEDSEK